jgi:hypothetical protein
MTNKFAPKLTFHLRCFIYASHWHKGETYPTLARAFNVNYQTVAKICRATPDAHVYHNIQAEGDRMGVEQMYKHYHKDELEERVNKARQGEHTSLIYRDVVASGPGRYWLKNWYGNNVEVSLQPYEKIKELVTFDPLDEFKTGIWFKHPETGWSFDEQPFESYEEALRFFAEFPPTWGK